MCPTTYSGKMQDQITAEAGKANVARSPHLDDGDASSQECDGETVPVQKHERAGSENAPEAGNIGNPEVIQVQKSKQRGISGFMLYVKENREVIKESLGGTCAPAKITKEAGDRWRILTDAEKEDWNKRGKEYRKPNVTNDGKEAEKPQDDSLKALFPISKVREIAKLDHEVHNISGSAVRILTKAAELFSEELAKTALECGDKKRIKLADVHYIVHSSHEKFGFLSQDFLTPAELEDAEMRLNKSKTSKIHKERIEDVSAPSKSKSISSYFS